LELRILVYKNWPLDAQLDCKLVDRDKLAKFVVAEDMLKKNENVLENAGYLKEIKF
jgi:hypothetical protein